MAVFDLFSKGVLFRLLVIAIAMLSTVSCATTYLAGTQSVDPEADNVTFMDDVPVYTSAIESSVLEFQFVPRETNWGRDHRGEPIQGSFFLQNLSNENIDFRPSDVWLIVWAEGESTAEEAGGAVWISLYRGADDIASYVAEIARESSRPDYVNTTGGVYTYLYGGTIGESIIASNQTRAANAAAQRDAQARRAQITEELDEFLLGRSTVEPGESISGGVGFTSVTMKFQGIGAPAGPMTEELVQAWRDGYYGVDYFADSLEPGTPLLEQIISNPETRETIQSGTERFYAEYDFDPLLSLAGPALQLNPRGFARIDTITGLLLIENEGGTHRVPVALDVHAVNGDEAIPVTFPYTP